MMLEFKAEMYIRIDEKGNPVVSITTITFSTRPKTAQIPETLTEFLEL